MNTTRLQAFRATKGYHVLPIRAGMQLELHEEVGEGSNRRIWRFKGLVLKIHRPNHADGTFTIRGKAAGHTIEKIYPLSFPAFKKVILLDEYRTRRAKLYYLRDKIGKGARLYSLLQKEEKHIDLLQLAEEEATALSAAYDATAKKDTKSETQETTTEPQETVAEDIVESQEAEVTTDTETKKEDSTADSSSSADSTDTENTQA